MKTPHPNPLPAGGEGDEWLPSPRHERRLRILSLAPAGRGWPKAGCGGARTPLTYEDPLTSTLSLALTPHIVWGPLPEGEDGEGDEWLPPPGHERRHRLLSENTPEATGAPGYQPRPFQGSEPNKESTTMPSSQKRIDANRANSRRSTGPRSESGKCRSSQNAIRHGLRTVKTTVLSSESIEEYADE